ncbi:MAG: hypothetical protein ACREGF_05290 [Candidatus Saccharimonadales bacterium]
MYADYLVLPLAAKASAWQLQSSSQNYIQSLTLLGLQFWQNLRFCTSFVSY